MAKKKSTEPTQGLPAGQYSNFLRIRFNAVEFILDFGQKVADTGAVQVHSRIVTSPQHAGLMKDLLEKTINDYKQKFGAPRPERGRR